MNAAGWNQLRAEMQALAAQQSEDHVCKMDCPCEYCRRMFRATTEERIREAELLGQEIAVRIEIEYRDGKVVRAVGNDAFEIVRAINCAQVMEYAHGRPYTGPTMKPVEQQPAPAVGEEVRE